MFAIGGNGAEIPIKAHWLNPDQMMILLMLSRTPAGKAMRRKMIELKNAVRDGRLVYADGGLVPSKAGDSVPPAATTVAPKPRKRLDPDEREYDAIDAKELRDRGASVATPFLVDHRNALRMRYDTFARVTNLTMREVWIATGHSIEALRKLAPIYMRLEAGPLPYFKMDGGDHEAIYLTLGQAQHMCFKLAVEDCWDSVGYAFDAYNAILHGETEREIAWREARAADAARLAAAPTTFGLMKAMAERAEGASGRISGEFTKLAESITSDTSGLAASVTSDISQLATSVTSGISGLAASVTSDISGLATSVTADMSRLAPSVTADVASLKASIEEMSGLLRESLQKKRRRLWPFG